MFKTLDVQNFRGIQELRMENLTQINLLVGENNSGKTTVLECIFLLIGASNSQLPLKINNFRNYNNIDDNYWKLLFYNLGTKKKPILRTTSDISDERRSLKIKPNIEEFISNGEQTKTIEKNEISSIYSSTSPTIDGLILEYTQEKKKGRRKREKKSFESKIFVQGPGVRITSPNNYKERLSGVFINSKTITGDIGGRFSNVKINKKTGRVIDILQRIEPRLKDLTLGKDGSIYCDIGLDSLIPVNMMGDGLFRLLSIVLAIQDTENGIVLIDEIENGFHFTSQSILWNAIFESASEFNVQIFATTHSLECVKAFAQCCEKNLLPKEETALFRIERRNGKCRVIDYDSETLQASIEGELEVR